MSIGTPTSLGSNSSQSSTNSTITITTSAAITAGNLAVAFFSFGSGGPTVSSVSDGTNTYTLAVRQKSASGNFTDEIWYKENASAVSSGATITATLSASTTGGFGFAAYAAQVSGIATSSSLDKTASSNTNSTSPSVSTGTLSQSSEIVFASSSVNAGGNTCAYTEASGFTNLFKLYSQSQEDCAVAYQIVSSTSSVTYNPSWSNSGGNGMETMVASFKAASSAVSGTLSATGTGSASFSGITIVASALSAAGSASVSEAGGGITAASMTAAGSASSALVGNKVLTGSLSSSGSASSSLSGSSVLGAVLSATGSAIASMAAELKQIVSTNMI